MALQIGTVDGLVNITPKAIYCFVNAIDAFSKGGIDYARKANVALGTAFQRFVEPVYNGAKQNFDLQDIFKPAYTTNNKEQSPARGTFCKKMGLLRIDDANDIFELTPLGREVMLKNITIEEYAFILLSKQGIFVDSEYKCNLLSSIAQRFEGNATISDWEISDYIIEKFQDTKIEKTRTDIIVNALCTTGLISKVNKGIYVLSNTLSAEILRDYKKNSQFLSPSCLDGDETYTEYMGAMKYGVFDIINNNNKDIYISQYPNLIKYVNLDKNKMNKGNKLQKPIDEPLQQIFYGAPGTGKSYKIKKDVEEANRTYFRTTFHPDSDYSTFVGCYKPTMDKKRGYEEQAYLENVGMTSDGDNHELNTKGEIIYSFTPQAFTNAYIKAWQTDEPVFLIIEEINRGNCAQIFGDLFQLLDRDENDYSQYKVDADTDLADYIREKLGNKHKEGIPKYIYEGDEIKLQLPNNLYIWATMNTSDQSLFPIDSAFKRRWEWVYRPIAEGEGKYEIEGQGENSWWKFIQGINEVIDTITHSEDKKLGYYFCKPANKDSKVITKKTFVNKVVFYLWNDVFKVYGFKSDIFDKEPVNNKPDNKQENKITFKDFYKDDGNVNDDTIKTFVKNVIKKAPKAKTQTEEENQQQGEQN